ncbi:thiol-disulfide oxidoreductase DCC family protein [Roseibacillus ishigakijimensis]|uniref:DUF393 domain-containing protein n=1 Tax=Roseibacillus ishigakijimensis TaxID=454146 RepID=A0A934VL28_9BACT|nr:DCC1-like thiol-disulfide oxidoreductase family protein [Roseibacillus ishigakijimensis]MBK1832696.1 DUF393 domain-containing protein [Roseibacillus ishigakijimensis]
MNTLFIFTDSECGLCRSFRRWLERQDSIVSLHFLPYQSPATEKRFPFLKDLDAGKDLVVLSEDGRWWQGPPAWLTCLWVLPRYRSLARRLASPLLLPMASRACQLLSEKRFRLAHLLQLENEELRHKLQRAPSTCTDSCPRPE